jgi:hypothetical protein
LCPTTSQKNFFGTNEYRRPPPRRQKIFGQCTILGVKKTEQHIANIAQFLSKYCTTTFILTTNCALFGFFAFLFLTLQTRTDFLSKEQTIFR